jgi:cell division protease FtsH
MQDNSDNKKKKQGAVPSNKKRPPMALVVWMLVFIAAGALFIFSSQQTNTHQLDQSSFEGELTTGNIKTVVLTPETNTIMSVEGKYKTKGVPAEAKYSSRIIYTNSLDKLLRDDATGKYKLNVTIKNENTWVRSLIVTLLPIILLVGLLYFLFSRQMRMAGKGAMQFGKSKARMISPDKNKTKFADVAGAEEAKEETMEIMDYLKDPLKFKLLGAKIPKGAMLIGPPGTGKTMMAKAIAAEADVPFFAISGSDFVEMFVGVGASRVRNMFEEARKCAPCLIFIDEIDAVGRSRFTGIGGGHDEREQTLNAMLVELDGLETQEGVIVLAATNRPDVLDPALVRPGRFDRQIVLDLPDIKGRLQILTVHTKNIKIDSTIDLDIMARGTPGFSGADIANLVNEAALLAARANREAATHIDFEEARDKVCWGRERRSRRISEKERKITAYHEAGHTLVQLYCKHCSPLHKVTIIPRGVAYLGATMQLAEEDKYTQSRGELEDAMAMAMGGRSAEEIIFGHEDITSGASGDIKQVTKMAKAMVCAYGMSEKMGTIAYGSREDHVFVGRDITRSEDYSEETARELDIEIKRIIDTAKIRSDKIIQDHKDQLEVLAQELLKEETLTANEVKMLLGFKIDIKKPDEEEAPIEKQKLKRTAKPTRKRTASNTTKQKILDKTAEKKITKKPNPGTVKKEKSSTNKESKSDKE